jgi:hypothetical protein
MELKIKLPHFNLRPQLDALLHSHKPQQDEAAHAHATRNLGYGEVDYAEQLVKQQQLDRKVRDITFRSFFVSGLAFFATGASATLGTAITTVLSGGTSLFFFMAGLMPLILSYSEKKSRTPPTNEMGLEEKNHGAVELNTMAPHHSVLVSEHGQESTFWKLELIKNAKQSIELSGSFCGGKAFRDGLESMRSEMKRNKVLKVHIISNPEFLHKEDIELAGTLKKQFPGRFNFLISDARTEYFPRLQTVENHVKLLVVDEQYFVIGGSGFREALNHKADGTDKKDNIIRSFADKIFPRYWRDNDVVCRGALAKTLRLEFFKLYAKHAYRMKQDNALVNRYFAIDPLREVAHVSAFETQQKKIDDVSMKVVVGSPKSSENAITREYCELLKKARPWEEVHIGNMLFNPAPALYKEIGEAVKRGVKVQVITNGIHSGTSKILHLFCWPNRLRYFPLMKMAKNKNFSIYEFHLPDGKYHSKTWVVGNKSICGSYNWGEKSHKSDDEVAVVIESEKVARAIKAILRKDKDLSVKISENEARRWQGVYGILGRFENAVTARFYG